MAVLGLEILGVILAVLGWILSIVSCALPMWRVSAFIGVNIITAQTIWEGIWMTCVVQSTGQMQCKVYDSMLALSSDLQAARALTIVSIVVGIMGVLVAVVGAKCTNYNKKPCFVSPPLFSHSKMATRTMGPFHSTMEVRVSYQHWVMKCWGERLLSQFLGHN
uniref:Claudin 4 n=1 Tax=Hucho hucho TaxID=62062 RepID=A0A4W5PUL8_9TELE